MRGMFGGQMRVTDHLPAKMAQMAVARIKEKQVGMPVHLIPYATIAKATNAPKTAIPVVVDDAEVRTYKGKGHATRFVGWEGFRRIITEYGWRDEAHNIDFDRLPKDASDADQDRQIYARAIQLRFMTAKFMGNPDGIID